jgi:uncharacterized Zn ribbon protein
MGTPIKFAILWGEDPDPEATPSEYEFKTQDEVDAFWLGVNEAEGWDGYRLIEDGDVIARDANGNIIKEDEEIIIIKKDGERRVLDFQKF